ncbi:phosphoadenylyl-sulfate reductase [Telmatospirillum siberiense]|uniref:Adenosine 5'-phosphosulfate reductase n=1 Tax=Telmatospirillum siberiense TaxID=382514 RepID=A0A2N3PWL6_9PROT|nr:phosphoadenylyl-sulfate reductase [Telmatospirillum siberiense]PKU24775.1 phosphoadenylyl-sulfate reductase [Telmatospirillum siberiense]
MSIEDDVARLRGAHGDLDGLDLIAAMRREFPQSLAVISSFGAEAAVLLDLVAQCDKTIPVIFLDTGELFDETLAYQVRLTEVLGLRNLRVIRPDPEDVKKADELWLTDADACCNLRKVQPLRRAVRGFRALIDGRKQYHGGGRESLSTIEAGAGEVVKIAPLARWSQQRIDEAFRLRKLPAHPLVAQGYHSIGCWPCSRPTGANEPVRAGRWAGAAKTECGIHRVSK